MNKLKGLLLTEGLHGMISQVEGLAKALDLDYFHEKIELNNFWKLIPPSLTPVKKYVFKNNIEKEFDIIISCGRKSVVPSIYLKKNSNKKFPFFENSTSIKNSLLRKCLLFILINIKIILCLK